jgi:chromate transporter
MDEASPLTELSLHLALLSLMAVGGGLVMIAPEIRAYVVDAKHWLRDEQFAAAYTIAQAAPGPNLLFISLIGWFLAGWKGAIVATGAVIVPPAVLTITFARTGVLRMEHPVAQALRDAFLPMAIGLICATAWIFMGELNGSLRADVLTLACALVVIRTRFNPVLLIAAGAVLGVLQVV